jgi:hypothetical protein
MTPLSLGHPSPQSGVAHCFLPRSKNETCRFAASRLMRLFVADDLVCRFHAGVFALQNKSLQFASNTERPFRK